MKEPAVIIHKPVLVDEVLTYINPQPGKTYLDATFGSGGHTNALLQAQEDCNVIALDWDAKALEQFGYPLQEKYGSRLRLIWGNFAHLYKILHKEKITGLDGILADFGTSQMQITSRSGFSFNIDTPLDMRMSPSHHPITAANVVNTAAEDKLVAIFSQLGEERFSRTIARAIVEKRAEKKFATTKDLADLVARIVPKQGFRRIHPATKVFQALRIYVNHELDNITALLAAAYRIIAPGGRIVCISFHSLEDRIVKRFIRGEQDRDDLPGNFPVRAKDLPQPRMMAMW